jgi:hypothetical protein
MNFYPQIGPGSAYLSFIYENAPSRLFFFLSEKSASLNVEGLLRGAGKGVD